MKNTSLKDVRGRIQRPHKLYGVRKLCRQIQGLVTPYPPSGKYAGKDTGPFAESNLVDVIICAQTQL